MADNPPTKAAKAKLRAAKLGNHPVFTASLPDAIGPGVAGLQVAMRSVLQGQQLDVEGLIQASNCFLGPFLALAAQKGPAVWESICCQYSDKLAQHGEPHWAAAYQLAVGNVEEAIAIYRTSGLLAEAVVLASSQLLPGSSLEMAVRCEYAAQLEAAGQLEVACSQWLLAGRPEAAIRALAMRQSYTALLAAAEIALQVTRNGSHDLSAQLQPLSIQAAVSCLQATSAPHAFLTQALSQSLDGATFQTLVETLTQAQPPAPVSGSNQQDTQHDRSSLKAPFPSIHVPPSKGPSQQTMQHDWGSLKAPFPPMPAPPSQGPSQQTALHDEGPALRYILHSLESLGLQPTPDSVQPLLTLLTEWGGLGAATVHCVVVLMHQLLVVCTQAARAAVVAGGGAERGAGEGEPGLQTTASLASDQLQHGFLQLTHSCWQASSQICCTMHTPKTEPNRAPAPDDHPDVALPKDAFPPTPDPAVADNLSANTHGLMSTIQDMAPSNAAVPAVCAIPAVPAVRAGAAVHVPSLDVLGKLWVCLYGAGNPVVSGQGQIAAQKEVDVLGSKEPVCASEREKKLGMELEEEEVGGIRTVAATCSSDRQKRIQLEGEEVGVVRTVGGACSSGRQKMTQLEEEDVEVEATAGAAAAADGPAAVPDTALSGRAIPAVEQLASMMALSDGGFFDRWAQGPRSWPGDSSIQVTAGAETAGPGKATGTGSDLRQSGEPDINARHVDNYRQSITASTAGSMGQDLSAEGMPSGLLSCISRERGKGHEGRLVAGEGQLCSWVLAGVLHLAAVLMVVLVNDLRAADGAHGLSSNSTISVDDAPDMSESATTVSAMIQSAASREVANDAAILDESATTVSAMIQSAAGPEVANDANALSESAMTESVLIQSAKKWSAVGGIVGASLMAGLSSSGVVQELKLRDVVSRCEECGRLLVHHLAQNWDVLRGPSVGGMCTTGKQQTQEKKSCIRATLNRPASEVSNGRAPVCERVKVRLLVTLEGRVTLQYSIEAESTHDGDRNGGCVAGISGKLGRIVYGRRLLLSLQPQECSIPSAADVPSDIALVEFDGNRASGWGGNNVSGKHGWQGRKQSWNNPAGSKGDNSNWAGGTSYKKAGRRQRGEA